MGHVSILLDKMRLDEMGLDEMGINREPCIDHSALTSDSLFCRSGKGSWALCR